MASFSFPSSHDVSPVSATCSLIFSTTCPSRHFRNTAWWLSPLIVTISSSIIRRISFTQWLRVTCMITSTCSCRTISTDVRLRWVSCHAILYILRIVPCIIRDSNIFVILFIHSCQGKVSDGFDNNIRRHSRICHHSSFHLWDKAYLQRWRFLEEVIFL